MTNETPKNGFHIEYFDSNTLSPGKKRKEGNYKDGKEDGKWTTWHDNGQIKVEEQYINGKLVSETEYDNTPLNPKKVKELVGLIDQKIASDAVAKQFVLEELEAATMGNDFAKNFVLTSGFKSEDYKGAMSKSWVEVDGDSGPQQALLGFVFAIANDYGMDAAVELRVTLVDGIMQLYNIGKYAQEGNKK